MNHNLKYKRYNECSILVEWPAIIDESILQNVLSFKNCIENNIGEEIVEVITTYNSLLIIYILTIDNINDKISTLKTLYTTTNNTELSTSRYWEIPVCYDTNFGTDLEAFSKAKQLSKPQIISLHSKPTYTVFFIGFLPGFLYLGGLDKKLHLDRKITPEFNVKKGAVAIGGKQTGIYPKNSPGGWHIIGNSPIDFFNPKMHPPSSFKPGDKIKFFQIDKVEYNIILRQIKAFNYKIKSVLIA